MQRLTLIGMPGSGKSAVGKIVAQRLGWSFVDTDHLIEERLGAPLQALVDELGAESFREVEKEVVLALDPPERAVIATGGSVVYSEAAMHHLGSLSRVVFLDAPIDELRRHIASEAPRGIVGMAGGDLEELYRQRLPLYRMHADVTISTGAGSPEEIAERVLSLLRSSEEKTDQR